MRHQNAVKSLDRSRGGRKALLRTQTISVVLRGHIRTTKAKAKVTQAFVERLITRAKVNTEATRRYLLANLNHIGATNRLMKAIAPAAMKRQGGYTRITKLGFRKGDAAELVQLELVDQPTDTIKPVKAKKVKAAAKPEVAEAEVKAEASK